MSDTSSVFSSSVSSFFIRTFFMNKNMRLKIAKNLKEHTVEPRLPELPIEIEITSSYRGFEL